MYSNQQLIGKGRYGGQPTDPPIPAYTAVKISLPGLGDPNHPFLDPSGLSDSPIGVLGDRGMGPGDDGNYVYFGPAKIRVDSTSDQINPGSWVKTNEGRAYPANQGDRAIGRALGIGRPGELLDIFVNVCLAPNPPA